MSARHPSAAVGLPCRELTACRPLGAGTIAGVRRTLVIACVLIGSLAPVSWAQAATQASTFGDVTATFTFEGTFPNFSGESLTIARGGTVYYNEPVGSRLCGKYCGPLSTSPRHPSVHVLNLEPGGEPDVVLDLYSGGAHCCSIEQIFSFDPVTMTYLETQRDFGDPGERIVDLGHNGRYEFVTADDAFAYEFTDYAASGLPIEILTFSQRHFVDVTRSYPKLIAQDASRWLHVFSSMASVHYRDSVGVIAAWAADEDQLGHETLVSSYLAQQAGEGHLNSPLHPSESGTAFISKLGKFLRRHGYVH